MFSCSSRLVMPRHCIQTNSVVVLFCMSFLLLEYYVVSSFEILSTLPSSKLTSSKVVRVSRRSIIQNYIVTSWSSSSPSSASSLSSSSLDEFDPTLAYLIQQEDQRQKNGLELIASENFVSSNVRCVLGSCLTNKYSEGNGTCTTI